MPDTLKDWMKPMDRRILELMTQTASAKPGGIYWKPGHLAKNLDASRNYINHRIRELLDHGYVNSDNGYYRVTEKGMEFARR